jgi:SDR family mycofactocin-dependent oxidoreductase
MGKFEGKVAFISGAARGQGRSHAVRFAQEGADVIAFDVCKDISTTGYPLATSADLAETVRLVEQLDRRIVAVKADVRDLPGVQKAFNEGLAQFGRVDFVLCNAGIVSILNDDDPMQAFRDVIDVNLVGVWNTIYAALPTLLDQGEGGSIVITSSAAGLKGIGGPTAGGNAYVSSKHGLVGLMRNLATNYSPLGIRVNTVHPTGVNTPMVINERMAKILAEMPEAIGATSNLMPIEIIEPSDVSDAVVWLCSDAARYITGVALPVDAGCAIK